MEDKNVPVVEVKDLVVHYETYDGVVEAVTGFHLKSKKRTYWDWWVRLAQAKLPLR